jgi:hypothetical protein
MGGEAIKTLLGSEDLSALVIELKDKLRKTKSMQARMKLAKRLKIIEGFFNDIKDHSVRPEVIAEIRKPWNTNTISMLVSSCWQSGLDYSDYMTDIAMVFLESDYVTAIECMTVISESVNNSSRERKDEIIRIVRESPLSFTNEKNALTQELISILEK